MGTDREARLEAALKAVRAGVDAQIAYLQTCRYDIDHALAAEATTEPPTPEPERPAERCVWREERGSFTAGCGMSNAALTDGRFCPYCGKPLSAEDTHAGE